MTKEIEFNETDEMYKLINKINNYEYIDRKELDSHISGESEEDLENEVSNFLEDLHDEMVDLANFINDNFKNIKVELPVIHDINYWIKHYKERKEQLDTKASEYTTQFWIGYNKGESNECVSIIKILESIKKRIES